MAIDPRSRVLIAHPTTLGARQLRSLTLNTRGGRSRPQFIPA
jgi:hypothetical protein